MKNMNFAEFITSKSFIYSSLLFVILINVVFYPDLFNNKDIRLNDLSYLLDNKREDSKIAEPSNTNSEQENAVVINEQETSEKDVNEEPLIPSSNNEKMLNENSLCQCKDLTEGSVEMKDCLEKCFALTNSILIFVFLVFAFVIYDRNYLQNKDRKVMSQSKIDTEFDYRLLMD